MAIKFNFLNGKSQINAKNLALFSDENFQILNIKSLNLKNQGLISDLIQNNKDKKKEILHLNLNKKQNLLVIKIVGRLKENISFLKYSSYGGTSHLL